MHIDGDSAPVVDDGDAVVLMDRHIHMVAISGQRLVDGIVHNLIDEMMKSAFGRAADIHAGTHTDGLKTFQYLDLVRVVRSRHLRNLGVDFLRIDRDPGRIEFRVFQVFRFFFFFLLLDDDCLFLVSHI